jgi:tetratricopeptide (TPR) repeat protein
MANINALKSQAAKLVVKGKYSKALGIYEKVKEMDPEEPGTYNLIGDVYLKMGEKEKAIEEFKQALKLYKKVQYYPNAIAVCKKIVRTDKEQVEVYYDLANLYVERGFIADAVVNFLEYASKMRAEGNKKQEIEAYRKVIELGPTKVSIRQRLVDLYIAEGERQAAIEELEKIEELMIQQGKQAELQEVEEKLANLKVGDMGEVGEKVEKVEKAEKVEEAKEVEKDKKLTVQQGFTMEDMMEGEVAVEEKVEEVKEKEEKVGKEEPTEEISFEEEIKKLQRAGRDKGEPVSIPTPGEDEVQSKPMEWTNFEELAQLCLSVNSKNEAVEYLYKAGEICIGEKNYEKAVKIYKRIIEIKPLELRPRQKLIEISEEIGDKNGIAEWNLDLGRCLYKKGVTEEAEKVFKRAHEVSSSKKKISDEIKKIKGEKVVVAEEEETSAISLDRLLEEEEKRGVKFEVAKEKEVEEPETFEDLLEEFKEGVLENIETKDYDSHYDLGITYKEMGLLDEAVEEFEKASEGKELKLKSIEMLALCLIEKGDLGEAEKVIKDALSLKGHKASEFLGLRYNLAKIYEHINKNKEAFEQFQEILKHDKDFKEAASKMEELEERIKKKKVSEKKGGTTEEEEKKRVEADKAKKEKAKKEKEEKERAGKAKKEKEEKKPKEKKKKKISFI